MFSGTDNNEINFSEYDDDNNYHTVSKKSNITNKEYLAAPDEPEFNFGQRLFTVYDKILPSTSNFKNTESSYNYIDSIKYELQDLKIYMTVMIILYIFSIIFFMYLNIQSKIDSISNSTKVLVK
jgi:hypothetical protein